MSWGGCVADNSWRTNAPITGFPMGLMISRSYKNYVMPTSHRLIQKCRKYRGCSPSTIADNTASWGHDEYIYAVMKQGSLIDEAGLYVLRYHSFYPWHTPQSGVQGYRELASEKDWHYLPLLKAFQKADLYSKLPELPPRALLEHKYHALLKQYIPKSSIKW